MTYKGQAVVTDWVLYCTALHKMLLYCIKYSCVVLFLSLQYFDGLLKLTMVNSKVDVTHLRLRSNKSHCVFLIITSQLCNNFFFFQTQLLGAGRQHPG